MVAPRILIVDIETMPSLAWVFDIWNQNIGINQLERDWRVMCFGAKWHGQPSVKIRCGEGFDLDDDYHLVKPLVDLLDEADVVIGHNVKKFDRRKINARAIELGLQPPSPYQAIDTWAELRKIAAFTSSKLEFLTQKLNKTYRKDRHSKYPGMELWIECIKQNPRAWREMRKYQRLDVLSTEELWLRTRGWYETTVNLAAYEEGGDLRCTKCGSLSVQRRGQRTLSAGRYTQYRCNDCGGWSRARCLDRSQDRSRLLRSA
jgi:RNase H-like protein